ncbi:hypothetical protein M8J77_004769 [Diaphorina citri]|nr:hypothetical protein M8J77_004769 [Diaphorina citri]
MPGRSTTDAVFALRQLIEKYREKNKDLHLIFIDLEKAYDRIPRQEIWRCMREKGTPEKYVRIVQDMYRGVRTMIRSSVGMTESIPVGVGLHQGSALSPYVFDLVMDVMTRNVKDEAPWCMMFADDVVLAAESASILTRKLERWREKLENQGIKISRSKTVHMNFGSELKDHERVQFDGGTLECVDKFKYLGSTVDRGGTMDSEVGHRVNAGWFNWKKLSGVLCDKRITLRAKGKMYKSAVRPAMLYGAETWAVKYFNMDY